MPETTIRLCVAGCLILSLIQWSTVNAEAGAQTDLRQHTMVRMQDVARGSLLVAAHGDYYREMPNLGTDVHIRAAGVISKTTVVQRFNNPTREWIEGVYVFPLPEESAITRLLLRIGERTIRGQIREREAAKRVYDKARREGRKGGLMEQERPNIFTTSVANIAPGETVTVEIDYVDTLQYENDAFHIRFPMVVGPRYIPGRPINESVSGSGVHGWAMDTDVVRDAARITPPVQRGERAKINPINIVVELDAGFPIADIRSPNHAVDIEYQTPRRVVIRLTRSEYADRDFMIRWWPQKDQVPRAALFSESTDDGHYALVMIMPPDVDAARQLAQPRELVIVVDTSGSMHGLSLSQAIAAADFALNQLGPGDTFNVIRFDATTEQLFPVPQAADPDTVASARSYLRAMQAEGGTEMAAALRAALAAQTESGRLRQVVFITDGNVGDEARLFGIIQRNLRASRLFTIGIGSAPNGFFMRRAAQLGRGSFTFIGNLSEVRERMTGLFEKIRLPVMTDVRIEWPGAGEGDVWPAPAPDLYHGEPLFTGARLTHPLSNLTVHGRVANRAWQFDISAEPGTSTPAVSTLWARRKIKSLMDRMTLETLDAPDTPSADIRQQIVKLGITHHLLTRYTSLVAVEDFPSRPDTESLNSRSIPTNLPHGWSHAHVFGVANTATASRLYLLAGLGILFIAMLLYFGGRRRVAPG